MLSNKSLTSGLSASIVKPVLLLLFLMGSESGLATADSSSYDLQVLVEKSGAGFKVQALSLIHI